MTRRVLARVGVTLLVLGASLQTGEAYLRQSFLVGGARVSISWANRTIPYSVANVAVPGVTVDALEAALQRASQSWTSAPGSNITFQYVGRTAARPLQADGRNTIGFLSIPELEGVLGVTATLADVVSGEVVESDMFLNSAVRVVGGCRRRRRRVRRGVDRAPRDGAHARPRSLRARLLRSAR